MPQWLVWFTIKLAVVWHDQPTLVTLTTLFVCHFVADFLLQPRWMGKEKSSNFMVLLMHLMIQFAIVWLGLAIFYDPVLALEASAINALVHGIIDWNIWKGYKLGVYLRTKGKATPETWKYWDDHWFYATIGFDQLLHTLTLIFVLFKFIQ